MYNSKVARKPCTLQSGPSIAPSTHLPLYPVIWTLLTICLILQSASLSLFCNYWCVLEKERIITGLDYLSERCKTIGLVLERTIKTLKNCTKQRSLNGYRQKALWESTRGIWKEVGELGKFPMGRSCNRKRILLKNRQED